MPGVSRINYNSMVYYSTSAPIFPDSGKKNYSIQLRKQKSLCREQYPTEVKGEQKFTFWVYTLRCKLWRLGLPLGNIPLKEFQLPVIRVEVFLFTLSWYSLVLFAVEEPFRFALPV